MTHHSYPKKYTRQAQLMLVGQKYQLWVLFGVIVCGVLIEWGMQGRLEMIKSLASGMVLAFIAQSIFTRLAYRAVGARARRLVVMNLYLGQMLKWLITLLGFALIFGLIKPGYAALTLMGYIIMQLTHIVMTRRIC